MNATQTAIAEALETNRAGYTVAELVEIIGKSETTVRKNIKAMDDVVKDDSGKYRFTIIASRSALDDIAAAEVAAEAEVAAAEHAAALEEYTALMNADHAEMDEAPAEDDSDEDPYAEAEVEPEPEPATKKYTRHATPTTRTVRTNQITGAEIQVVKNGETDRDGNEINIPEKWATVCLTHKHVGGFGRVLDAHFASSYPEFCPTCKDAMPVETIGRRRRK